MTPLVDVCKYLQHIKDSLLDVQSVGVILMDEIVLLRVDWNLDVHASIVITKTELDKAKVPEQLDALFIDKLENEYKKWEVGEE